MADKDVLEREITGSDVRVRLGDRDYPLTFPNHNVAVYAKATASLNCRRGKAALDAGRAKLSQKEIRSQRIAFTKLAGERYDKHLEYRDAEGEAKAAAYFELQAIADEMIAIDSRLAEENGTGESLFKIINWWKIRDDDPERIALALWAGLHVEIADGKWQAPLSVGQIDKLLDLSNIVEVISKITVALGQYLPKVDDPKDDRPRTTAQVADETTTIQ